jgi:hypothetical protein
MCGCIIDSTQQVNTYFAKFTPFGDTLWTRQYGGFDFDVANAIYEMPTGNYFAVCNTTSFGHGGADFWLLELSPNGDSLRSFFYGSSVYEDAVNGDRTLDSGIVMSGMKNNHPYIVKADKNGNQEWAQSYPYADDYSFISQLPTGGYIITARKTTSTDGSQLCVIKTNDTGAVIWQNLYGTSVDDDYSYSKPIILNDGSIVIGGDFDPIASGAAGAVVLKIDSSGNQKWIRHYTWSSVTNDLYDIKPTIDGGFVFAGATYNTTQDSWVVKLDSLGCDVAGCDGVGFQELQLETSLNVFPNPSDGNFIIEWPQSIKPEKISIFDETGSLVYSVTPDHGTAQLEINPGLSSGIYLVQLQEANRLITKKLIVR